MSGGRLVVLDRSGRDIKHYPLPSGLVTLGRDHDCDIRIMLSSVSPHHATVVVHANQTVVRSVSDAKTLVNGQSVSVAALRHNDVITIGDRSLRWEYEDASTRRPLAPEPALDSSASVRTRNGREARRATAGGGAAPRSRQLQLELELRHRASMPGNAGGKQVAIVQPQRRDTNEQSDTTRSPTSSPRHKRPRSEPEPEPQAEPEPQPEPQPEPERPARKCSPRGSHTPVPRDTTKATLWIESRKTSPRKSAKVQTPAEPQPQPQPPRQSVVARRALSARRSTPLRVAVLRSVQSARAHRPPTRVTKILAPDVIDHTKQVAIMLMTGHTPKTKITPKQTKKRPSYAVRRPGPPPRTSRPARGSGSRSIAATPCRGTSYDNTRRTSRSGHEVSVLEITDSDATNSTIRASTASRRSKVSPLGSPLLPSPKKSALKDPKAKKSIRKTESIKFDLSNLESHTEDLSDTHGLTASEDDITLHYSDASSTQSPSPRKSIHSRSSRILEKLGTSIESHPESVALTPESPRPRKSLRGSIMVQKALETPGNNTTGYFRRTTKSAADKSWDTTVESAFKTRTLSPKSARNLESYSIVDLVSNDSNDSTKSVYDSVGSTRCSSIMFGTPRTTGRKTRSTIDPTLLSSSTPYVERRRATRSNSNPNISKSSPNKTTRSSTSRRSKSLSTPENTQKHISVNSTRVSRVSRSKSRIDESDLQFISSRFEDDADDSPKTSKRPSRASMNISNTSSPQNKRASRKNMTLNTSSASKGKNLTINMSLGSQDKNLTANTSLASQDGMTTPDQRNSPEEAGTPVLSIQSLLDSSQSSFSFRSSRRSMSKRKTIGAIRSERKKTRSSIKSKSLNLSARNLRLSKDSAESNKTDENSLRPDNEDIVTPKSAIKLVPEAVKNKHSTAKKPQSKRSIIDDLNESLQESDIVKQLFNSPVKRKLSQSMTEFSRKQLFDDDVPRRPTRNTVALTGRTPDNSLLNHTGDMTPDNFVSPLSTPGKSPNLTGIKRLFKRTTPENDLRNIKGIKGLLRTPRTRKSVKNDLTKVSGIKNVFAKSPKNRLSDVRVKEVFAASPRNDLRRVTGVKSLFQSKKKQNSPRNDLSDVRGVRSLYQRKSVANDLRNVSGVKKVLRASPKNDLTDVRGVRRMFRQEKQKNDYNDFSGIEELFNESDNSQADQNNVFDQLLGNPKVKSVYSKSFHNKKPTKKSAIRSAKSLHNSIDLITNNVEEWLEQELQKRVHKNVTVLNASKSKKSLNKSSNITRELQKLMTDTVEGTAPIRTSRIRNSTIVNSQAETSDRKKSASEVYSAHTLPIKKRSLVDASLEKRSNSKILPIKKRVVVHSTPVKGRYNLTMNASELGRVSPIASVDQTNLDTDTTIRSSQQKASPKPKGRRITNIQNIVEDETAMIEPSSPRRKTKAKELDTLTIQVPSPKQVKRSTRGTPLSPQQAKAIEKALKSPQAKRAIEEILKSPQAKRATKDAPKSPEAKRATKDTTKSPQAKRATKDTTKSPQANRATKDPSKSPQAKRATKDPPKSPEAKRATKDTTKSQPKRATKDTTKSPQAKNTTKESVKSPQARRATRGKQAAPKEEITIERKTRRTRNNTEKQEIQQPMSPKPKGRTRNNTEKQETQISPKPKGKRNTKATEQKVEKPKSSPKKTRASKTIQSPAQAKSTRSRRNKTDIPETKTKKGRPSLVITKKPPVLSPKGPKTTKAIESPKPRSTRRQKVEVEKPKTPKKTRATATKNTVIVSKPSPQLKPQGSKTRGKKAEIIKSPKAKKQESPKKSPPKRGRRNVSAVEEPKTKRGRNTKQSVETEPQPKRGRNTRTTEIKILQQSLQVTKPRGKKLVAQESVQSEPVTSNRRRNAPEPIADLPTRGRKRKADDIVSPKVTKTRGKVAEIQVKSPKGKQKKESKPDKSKKEEVVEKTTRGRAAKERGKVDEAKPVRGKKAAAAVVESVPAPSRKRKTNSTASPAIAAKRTRGAKAVPAAAVVESNPRGRARRNNDDKAVAPGRTRRR